MKLSDFDFDLPEAYIAQKPLEDRSASKLMAFDIENNKIIHSSVKNIDQFLNNNDVLVLNKSRVIPARIQGDFGEIFLAKPLTVIPAEAGIQDKEQFHVLWQCLVKPGKKFKEGKVIELSDGVKAHVLKVNDDGTRDIQFSLNGDQQSVFDFSVWLQKHGSIPQPPYVQEKIENPDRYQTVFSKEGKSVAAPTAGLHFTEELLQKLREKGVEIYFVHLDVGLGTFLPVKIENILEHTMHAEYYHLDAATADALNSAKQKGKRIIAVGTTSVRVLESCAIDPAGRATRGVIPQSGETKIFIYPGYKFKFVDALFTNFHTPKSTLLMLVSAFVENKTPESARLRSQMPGRDMILYAYEEAKKEHYRFYSFGDAMFLF